MAWTQPAPTISSGQTAGVSTAFNQLAANLTLIGGAWASFSPTISAGGTAITLGNGTIDAAYKQADKTVSFRISFTVGSSTTLGSGTLAMTLPVAAKSVHLVGAYILPSSGADGTYRNVSTTSIQFYSGGAAQSVATLSLASGSIILLSGTYEAA